MHFEALPFMAPLYIHTLFFLSSHLQYIMSCSAFNIPHELSYSLSGTRQGILQMKVKLARRKAYIYNAETPAKGLLFKKLIDIFLIGGTLFYSCVGFCCVTMQIIQDLLS